MVQMIIMISVAVASAIILLAVVADCIRRRHKSVNSTAQRLSVAPIEVDCKQ